MAIKTGWMALAIIMLQALSLNAQNHQEILPHTNDASQVRTNPIDSLLIKGLPQRFSFEVLRHQKLALCGLEKGETYLLFYNKDLTNLDCTTSLHCSDPAATRPEWQNEHTFQFVAQETSVNLEAMTGDCDAPFPVNLSVGCSSCGNKGEGEVKSLTTILTDENYTPQQLIEDIFVGGDCFDVDGNSIEFTGEPQSSGYFSNGNSSINVEDGVMLTSGNVAAAAGPNGFYNSGSSAYGLSSDPDLSALLSSNVNLYDVTALEFDFTPTTDNISFEFVFASEEYCEYVGSTFNDVFGFFISGPGINGPFSNNAANIALLPGTNANIAINNVNHESNANYYVKNIPASQWDDLPSSLSCDNYPQVDGIAINDIEFDGFTTVLTAESSVQACETYHIKLVIADVGDAYFDSAVFLKANSFDAGGNATVDIQSPNANVPNTVYENCAEPGYFIFTRSGDDLSQPLEVLFDLAPQSSATPGVDFAALPESVTIPAGDSIYYLPVDVVSDLLVEGNETIVLELETSCSCDMPFVEMQIADQEPMEVSLTGATLCDTTTPLTLNPVVSGGLPGYQYLWSTGAITASLDVIPNTTSTYSLTVTDVCGNEMVVTTDVVVTTPPAAIISGIQEICPGGTDATLQIDFTGTGPWDFSYSVDNAAPININNIPQTPFMLQTSDLGTYTLTAVSENGCEGTVQGTASVEAVTLDLSATTTTVSCPSWNDGSINVVVSNGALPYTYVWDSPLAAGANPNILPTGTYTLVVNDANGCTETLTETILLTPDIPEALAGTSDDLTCSVPQLTLNGSGSTDPTYAVTWTTIDGSIVSGIDTYAPVIDQGGTYVLEVTNTTTGCTLSDDLVVNYDTLSPVVSIVTLGPQTLDCTANSTVLDGTGSLPFGQLSYHWTTTDGSITPGEEGLPTILVNAPGTYNLEVNNMNNGCGEMMGTMIDQDDDLPLVNIAEPLPLTCIETQTNLDASGSSVGSEFTYEWTSPNGNIVTGNNGLSPLVDAAGEYTLVIVNTTNNCDQTASIELQEDIEAPLAVAGETPELLDCNTATVGLDGNASSQGENYIYNWTTQSGNLLNGENTLTPTVDAGGLYILQVINIRNGCDAVDQVAVNENLEMPTAMELEVTDPLCYGDDGGVAVTGITGGEEPYLYSIDGGENFYADTVFNGLPVGMQSVVIQDVNGCNLGEDVYIPDAPQLVVQLPEDETIKLGATFNLNAVANIHPSLIDTIIWSSEETLDCINCLDPNARPFETTVYNILLFNHNGCVAEDEITLRVRKDRDVFIPTAFSPNGDGNNDVFMIFANNESIKSVNEFQLFNRWGEKVFDRSDFMPNDPTQGWDGVMNGEKLNPSVFVYFAEIEFVDGHTEMYKGDFTLMR